MKVGLVLGAGGVMGGAWLTGGLHALARETGWDPASADYIVGTSAGSMMGALLSAGVPPWFMVAHSRGDSFEGVIGIDGRPASEADRAGGAVFRPHRGLPGIGPGSWSLIARTIANPTSYPPTAVLAGWAPKGLISTEPLKEQVRRAIPEGWSPHPNFWAVACDYKTGKRIPFGRDGSPPAELANAVAASCCIPGFYRPVEIGGREYVDGGIYSTSNMDMLRGLDLDLVICLNPTSSLHPTRAWNIAELTGSTFRKASGRRLGSEAKKVEASGTPTVLIQPTREDLAAMGPNLMARKGRNRVIETAERTVAEQLSSAGPRDLLARLPAGAPHKIAMPTDPPSEWPPLVELGDALARS